MTKKSTVISLLIILAAILILGEAKYSILRNTLQEFLEVTSMVDSSNLQLPAEKAETEVPVTSEMSYSCINANDTSIAIQSVCADQNGKEIARVELVFADPADAESVNSAAFVWSGSDLPQTYAVPVFWPEKSVVTCELQGIREYAANVRDTSFECVATSTLPGPVSRVAYSFDESTADAGLKMDVECNSKAVSSGANPVVVTTTETCKHYNLPQ